MKKIIIGVGSLVLLFVASSVFATSFWNGASNDCKTVSIANHETRDGFGDPCWPGTTISAQPGQSVNVRIYYHNTGNQTATNTRIVLNAPTINTKTSTHTFTGQIISDQGSSQSFTVKANLSSAQRLSYGATSWYTENINEVKTNLLYGQTGSEIINGGLRIGSITSGWSTQGSVVVSFLVENPQDCNLTSFTANPSEGAPGDPILLSWTSNHCNYVNILGEGNNLSPNGSKTVYTNTSRIYTLTGFGDTSIQPTLTTNVIIGGPAGAPTFPAGAPTFSA